MNISTYTSAYASGYAATDAVATVSGLGAQRNTSAASSTSGGDTVSISDEAKELFARKTRMLDDGSDEAIDSGSLDSTGVPLGKAVIGEAAVKGSEEGKGGDKEGASGKGKSSDSSNADKIKDIESQIKELSSQIESIMSGGGESTTKMQQAAPLQQKISALQAQLQSLSSKG